MIVKSRKICFYRIFSNLNTKSSKKALLAAFLALVRQFVRPFDQILGVEFETPIFKNQL